MCPKRVVTANDTKVAKHLQEAVQLLKLMEKPNITIVRKEIRSIDAAPHSSPAVRRRASLVKQLQC